ncbi:unnamed protein product [Nyctereutes procyonoides]|uniref:(raccoon dog) hypothetical protein n=1 Tax=Nyctereutes procyonoides TaxID=34880 RepID=A0A811YVM7_NYCPR|nr:unnamed protein product [Nyctereutes procyonoides]
MHPPLSSPLGTPSHLLLLMAHQTSRALPAPSPPRPELGCSRMQDSARMRHVCPRTVCPVPPPATSGKD